MLVQVTHDKHFVEIRWWPKGVAEPFNEWSVYKDVDPRGDSVRAAFIRDSRPQRLTVRNTEPYLGMLKCAYFIAISLDEAFPNPDDFSAVEVQEVDWSDDGVERIARPTKRKGMVTISIPRQERIDA